MMDNGGTWFEDLRAVREGNAASVDGNQVSVPKRTQISTPACIHSLIQYNT